MMGWCQTFTEHLQVTCKTLELGMMLTRVIHWCADIINKKPTCGYWKPKTIIVLNLLP